MVDRFEAVKENMYRMMKYSKEEHAKFKSTDNVVWLQQAGEKLFCALENYIQYLHQIQTGSFEETKNLVREKALRNLLYRARDLHRFFYNERNEMNIEDADELYEEVYKKVKARIDRIDKYDVGVGV